MTETDARPHPVPAPATHRVVGILGRGVVDADDLVLAADDLGLTRGDGCFEATRMVFDAGGTPAIDHLDEHFSRLAASSAALDLPAPGVGEWSRLIADCARAWPSAGEAMLRLMLTRGRESAPGTSTGVVTIAPISAVTLRQRVRGVTVCTLSRGVTADAFADAAWLLGGVKTLSYAVNVAAYREAARRGADDVIFVSTDGRVLEAPTAAVLWLARGTLHTTPPGATGILDSITQRALFGAVELDTAYTLAGVDELLAAEGVWLASSGRGVAAVRSIDPGRVPPRLRRRTPLRRRPVSPRRPRTENNSRGAPGRRTLVWKPRREVVRNLNGYRTQEGLAG